MSERKCEIAKTHCPFILRVRDYGVVWQREWTTLFGKLYHYYHKVSTNFIAMKSFYFRIFSHCLNQFSFSKHLLISILIRFDLGWIGIVQLCFCTKGWIRYDMNLLANTYVLYLWCVSRFNFFLIARLLSFVIRNYRHPN